MKPFNLADAIAGKPLVTRDGIPAKFLMYELDVNPYYRFIFSVDGVVYTCSDNGRVMGDGKLRMDLFMAEIEPKRFELTALEKGKTYQTKRGEKVQFVWYNTDCKRPVFADAGGYLLVRNIDGRLHDDGTDSDFDIFEVQDTPY